MMFHLKWSTLLATGLKNLAEVFDKGDGVVDRLGEGVDLFPGGACHNRNSLLLYNLFNISNPQFLSNQIEPPCKCFRVFKKLIMLSNGFLVLFLQLEISFS